MHLPPEMLTGGHYSVLYVYTYACIPTCNTLNRLYFLEQFFHSQQNRAENTVFPTYPLSPDTALLMFTVLPCRLGYLCYNWWTYTNTVLKPPSHDSQGSFLVLYILWRFEQSVSVVRLLSHIHCL